MTTSTPKIDKLEVIVEEFKGGSTPEIKRWKLQWASDTLVQAERDSIQPARNLVIRKSKWSYTDVDITTILGSRRVGYFSDDQIVDEFIGLLKEGGLVPYFAYKNLYKHTSDIDEMRRCQGA